MKLLLSILGLLVYTSVIYAQKTSISGIISDASTGETLIGATVSVKQNSQLGAISNAYGYYSLSLPQGNYEIVISYLGYQSIQKEIVLKDKIRFDIRLLPLSHKLNEVVIHAKKKNENIISPHAGIEEINIADVKQLPAMFGEQDIIKTMTLTAGVKSTSEGSGGMYVRGGNHSQNLILLDEATVYNTSHLMGFFSTFNGDAIKNATLYKGTAPAQYGGRISSVLDLKMNEGNNQSFHFGGGIGLLSAHAYIEGPIIKEKGSFLITARRTYADLFLKLSNKENLNKNELYFYDLNLKANYKLNANNRIYLSGYLGKDVLDLKDIAGIDWGNETGTFRWNHIWNDKLFNNTSLIYSKYNYESRVTIDDYDRGNLSSIESLQVKQDFQYYLSPQHQFSFGLFLQKTKLTPGQQMIYDNKHHQPPLIEDKRFIDYGGFLNHSWKINSKIKLSTGLRISNYQLYAGNTYNSAHYFQLEPRFNIAYVINSNQSFKGVYTRNTQQMHLLQSTSTSSTNDIWLASTNRIKPEIGDQISLCYFRNFAKNKYQLSIETYYKWMQNQIDLKDGADSKYSEDIEQDLCYGNGRAYGIEFMLKKKTGKLTGWLSYTLSRSEKKIDEINQNKWYPTRQDATHDISIVGMYQLNKKWTLCATWLYSTGNAATFPSGKYECNGSTQLYYTERNGYRMPDYHRLDLGATCHFKSFKHFQSSLSLSLYNAYGRRNAYMIDFKEDPDDNTRTIAERISLFSFMPSISYQFKF